MFEFTGSCAGCDQWTTLDDVGLCDTYALGHGQHAGRFVGGRNSRFVLPGADDGERSGWALFALQVGTVGQGTSRLIRLKTRRG